MTRDEFWELCEPGEHRTIVFGAIVLGTGRRVIVHRYGQLVYSDATVEILFEDGRVRRYSYDGIEDVV